MGRRREGYGAMRTLATTPTEPRSVRAGRLGAPREVAAGRVPTERAERQ